MKTFVRILSDGGIARGYTSQFAFQTDRGQQVPAWKAVACVTRSHIRTGSAVVLLALNEKAAIDTAIEFAALNLKHTAVDSIVTTTLKPKRNAMTKKAYNGWTNYETCRLVD